MQIWLPSQWHSISFLEDSYCILFGYRSNFSQKNNFIPHFATTEGKISIESKILFHSPAILKFYYLI